MVWAGCAPAPQPAPHAANGALALSAYTQLLSARSHTRTEPSSAELMSCKGRRGNPLKGVGERSARPARAVVVGMQLNTERSLGRRSTSRLAFWPTCMCLGWKRQRSTTPPCPPVKLCVQKPPAMSHTWGAGCSEPAGQPSDQGHRQMGCIPEPLPGGQIPDADADRKGRRPPARFPDTAEVASDRTRLDGTVGAARSNIASRRINGQVGNWRLMSSPGAQRLHARCLGATAGRRLAAAWYGACRTG